MTDTKAPIRHIAAFIIMAGFLCAFAGISHADPKPSIFFWGPDHWDEPQFRPYFHAPKDTIDRQWHESDLDPSDWLFQGETGVEIIKGLYANDVLTGQYIKKDIPVLEVGPIFYRLGDRDKRRVTALVDQVFQVTDQKENGLFYLNDWETKETIGVYTKHGLQLR